MSDRDKKPNSPNKSPKNPQKDDVTSVDLGIDIHEIRQKIRERDSAHSMSHAEATLLASTLDLLLRQVNERQRAQALRGVPYVVHDDLAVVLGALSNTIAQTVTRVLQTPSFATMPDASDLRLFDLAIRTEMTWAFERGWRASHLTLALGVSKRTADEIVDWVHYRDPKSIRTKTWCNTLYLWLLTNEPTQAPWKIRETEVGREAMAVAMWVGKVPQITSNILPPPR